MSRPSGAAQIDEHVAVLLFPRSGPPTQLWLRFQATPVLLPATGSGGPIRGLEMTLEDDEDALFLHGGVVDEADSWPRLKAAQALSADWAQLVPMLKGLFQRCSAEKQ